MILSTKKLVILLLILIGVFGIGIAALNYPALRRQTIESEDQDAVETEETVPALPANQSGIVIPEEVYSYQGQVIEKGENFLKLKIGALDNYIETDQEIEARFDEQTAMTQILISSPAETNQKPRVEMRGISAAEIEIGEAIIVTTRENIKGRTSFRAESIRVVSQKQF